MVLVHVLRAVPARKAPADVEEGEPNPLPRRQAEQRPGHAQGCGVGQGVLATTAAMEASMALAVSSQLNRGEERRGESRAYPKTTEPRDVGQGRAG